MPQEQATSTPFPRALSKIFSWRDPIDVGGLLLGGALAAVAPSAADGAAVRTIAKLFGCARRNQAAVIAAMRRTLHVSEPDAQVIFERHLAMRADDSWARMRGILRPGWRLHARIEGLDLLEDALDRGRGAVIWLMRTGATLANFHAFALAGHPLNHVSMHGHGALSKSKLSVCSVAPLYLRSELAALNSRIVIPLKRNSHGYLKHARRCLRENQCVSLFGEHPGSAYVEASLLGEPRKFAIGAPSLAWMEDAALFIAHTRASAPLHQVVTLEPVAVDRSIPMRAFAEAATRQYVQRLEAWIHAHPASWQGWSYLRESFPSRMPNGVTSTPLA